MSLNSISNQFSTPLWRRDGGCTSPEAFQYLSRQRYSDLPVPVVSISPVGPIETVADAVARQWQKVADNQLIDVDPTFSAAPQSEYYGSVVLPDGQVLHRSSAQNVFRVFRDRKSGLSYTISCHEFTFHLAAPRDPQRAWQLKLVYPNDTRIRDAMNTMTPLQPPDSEDLGFPVHATQQVPPMVLMAERLRVSIQYLYDMLVANDLQLPVNSPHRADTDTVQPHIAPPGILNPNATMALDIHRSPSTQHKNFQDFADDIDRRAQETVAMDGDMFRLSPQSDFSTRPQTPPIRGKNTDRQRVQTSLVAGSDSRSDPESLPELEEWSDAGSVDMDVCGLCFEAQHQSTMDCPLFGAKTRTTVDVLCSVLENLRNVEGMWYLDDWLSLNIDDAYVIEPFSMEMHCVLNVALGPTLKEWLSMPLSASLSYQALATTACKARKAFEFFTHDTKLRMDEMHEKNLQRKDEGMEDDLEAQREREVEGIIARMQKELAAEMDEHLQAHNSSTREQLQREEGRLRSAEDPNFIGSVTSSDNAHSPYLTALSPPALNPHHGDVITHDSWSSSSSGSSDSGSYEEVHIPQYSTLSEQFAVLPVDTWSPVSAEWSVEDFLPNPTWVIDNAIARLRLRSSGRIDSASEYPTSTDSNYLTSYASSSPDSQHPQYSRATNTPANPSETEASTELQENLFHWVHDGNWHLEESIQVENEWITDPAQHALELLGGALTSFVDNTTAMDGVQGLLMLAASSGPNAHDSALRVNDAPIAIDPTLLAIKLPTQEGAVSSDVLANPATGANATEIVSNVRLRDIPMHPMHFASQKRKGPEGEENGFDQTGKRKKFPTGLTNTKVIELFAGVQLGIKETIRRVEEMVWTRFEITQVRAEFDEIERECSNNQSTVAYQQSFPSKFARHPLLFDLEATQLQTLVHVLQFHGCLRPAAILEEVLAIRLRNEYAVAHLLNAGYLDYPEESSHYWDLFWSCSPGNGRFDDPASESTDDNASDSNFSVDMDLLLTYPSILDERAPNHIDEDHDEPAPTHDYPPLFDDRISAHVSDLLSWLAVIHSELVERLSIHVDAGTQTDGVHRGDSGGREDDDNIVLQRRVAGSEDN
ncbi:hypothetical protein B0H16DRAFT_1464475 [Mycena metata]|uniref:Uncharacterized protein n=1 Tax=Mycena metata TaxID=1033252 RepID=A0AAD7IGJ6_9AGAR|nr:hypothetical protein B0H16DRAFT_1464475 [Mycena metata]